jgi:hypothetical protein
VIWAGQIVSALIIKRGQATATDDEPVCVLVRANSLKPPCAVPQPDDHIIRMEQVSPDQIGVAIVINILGKEPAGCAAVGVELDEGELACAAEVYLYALDQAGSIEPCAVNYVVAIKI